MARYDKHAHKIMFTEDEFQHMGLADEASIEEILDCFEDEGGLGSPADLHEWYKDLRRTS